MIKVNKHIEIVRSSKSWLSSMSQESCDGLITVLSKHYAEVGVTTVNNLSDLKRLVASKPDLVFLGMKFVPMDPALGLLSPAKIWVTKYLDEFGVAYTGSGHVAHKLELNKPLAKQRALDAGISTSPFHVIKQNQQPIWDDISLAFPMFVKPTNRGGGLGIDSDSVVHNFDQLQAKVASIATGLQSDSLIEEYVPGREFSVAILKNEYSGEFSVMPIELVTEPNAQGIRLLSSAIKTSNSERAIEVTDKVIKSKVSALAIDIFHALGAQDYGRIDIRLNESGTPQFLEANLIPSLISGYGSFPKACVLNLNLDYEPMILSIVRLALARSVNASQGAPAIATAYDAAVPTFEAALLNFEL